MPFKDASFYLHRLFLLHVVLKCLFLQNSKLLSVQNQLFNRISVNYVNLLCENVDLRWRDPFFKVKLHVATELFLH